MGSVTQPPQPEPTPAYLLGAPLAQLLEEFGVRVSVLEVEPGFTGWACINSDGSMLFVRPACRPESEWEIVARSMLGRALGVELPPPPEPYRVTEL
ncbi:hypothetical protein [Streptomyces griseofuscus]|uniref:Uncharacterized protein n=1 Tax=Streptomyces griseofuscus TaxID=146922 RepID=A0A426RZ38_9ACTN|nr:hypothetical protein [Streptomyces griseofuscus]RRQ81529.1 hypothetical protein CQW44_30475 [Streptomyces griseofuscus]